MGSDVGSWRGGCGSGEERGNDARRYRARGEGLGQGPQESAVISLELWFYYVRDNSLVTNNGGMSSSLLLFTSHPPRTESGSHLVSKQ